MSATYNGLQFKTKLEARWAAFFDLAGWQWWTNPVAVGDWQPDFKVKFECGHSECSGSHSVLVAVLPFDDLARFKGHPCTLHYPPEAPDGKALADGAGGFGSAPSVTQWDMAHGAGGGMYDVEFWVDDAGELWSQAAKLVH